MASEVLSGSSNPTYTNNTGKNVRLVINSLKSCTSFSFTNAGTVQVSSLTNVLGLEGSFSTTQYVAPRTDDPYSASYGWFTRSGGTESTPFSGVRQLVIRFANQTIYDGPLLPVINNEYVIVNNLKYYPKTYRGSNYGWSGDYSNAFDIVRSGQDLNIIRELALAPNQTFSAVCEAYNIVAIKEDGT